MSLILPVLFNTLTMVFVHIVFGIMCEAIHFRDFTELLELNIRRIHRRVFTSRDTWLLLSNKINLLLPRDL